MSGPDADGFIQVDAGSGAGGSLDTTAVAYGSPPATRQRERVVIGGDLAAELADVLNVDPSADTYGLVVRPVEPAAVWSEIASAVNATATATRAAVAGQSHYITSVVGSFDIVPTTGVRMDLREAGVNKMSVFMDEFGFFALAAPFKMAVNSAATLVLGAGGIGSTGLVTLQGYTA